MDVREPESDGEIDDDEGVYDSISSQEEDFFIKIQNEIKKTESRKAELELENSFGEFLFAFCLDVQYKLNCDHLDSKL